MHVDTLAGATLLAERGGGLGRISAALVLLLSAPVLLLALLLASDVLLLVLNRAALTLDSEAIFVVTITNIGSVLRSFLLFPGSLALLVFLLQGFSLLLGSAISLTLLFFGAHDCGRNEVGDLAELGASIVREEEFAVAAFPVVERLQLVLGRAKLEVLAIVRRTIIIITVFRRFESLIHIEEVQLEVVKL